MLVFVDESGDSGLKIETGSSRFFTIGLVVFEDPNEGVACDQRIELLKHELGWNSSSEFHFRRNSDRVRETFLRAVAPYNFFYYGFVINKDPKRLYGDGFKDKSAFYKFACGLLFENARDRLVGATVVIDQSGNTEFRKQLATYLRRRMNDAQYRIGKVKMQRSESNNLLQLADYVASIVNRSVTNQEMESNAFRRLIAHREIRVQVWPTENPGPIPVKGTRR